MSGCNRLALRIELHASLMGVMLREIIQENTKTISSCLDI
jgi:hypothetical protein